VKGGNARKSSRKLNEFQDGRDANNLAEWPLSLLSDTVPDGLKTIEFQDTIDDWKSGKTLVRRVCITGSDKFGLPTAKDEEILLALLQLTKIQNNFESPEISFCKNEIIELLGWKNCGWSFQRIEESLHRWKGTSIHFWNAWRDHRNKLWKNSEALGVIDYVQFKDGRSASGPDDRSRCVWNRSLFETCQAGNLRKLDFSVFRSLSRPAAKRAFRFLGKRFHFESELEFDLRLFACEKLGFSREYDTGQLKERLRPALGELEKIGFIEPVEFRKSRPKVWTIKVELGKGNRQDADSLTANQPGVVADLVARGIALKTAEKFSRELPEDEIREQIANFDRLVKASDKRISENPPGWLVSAISRKFKWKIPKTKIVQPSGHRANPATMEKPQIDTEAESERQHFEGLSPDQRSQLESAALAAAGKVISGSYHRLKATGGPLFEALQRKLVLDQLRKMPIRQSASELSPLASGQHQKDVDSGRA
jgi:hypothetical protein